MTVGRAIYTASVVGLAGVDHLGDQGKAEDDQQGCGNGEHERRPDIGADAVSLPPNQGGNMKRAAVFRLKLERDFSDLSGSIAAVSAVAATVRPSVAVPVAAGAFGVNVRSACTAIEVDPDPRAAVLPQRCPSACLAALVPDAQPDGKAHEGQEAETVPHVSALSSVGVSHVRL